jgi:hypothetical protein
MIYLLIAFALILVSSIPLFIARQKMFALGVIVLGTLLGWWIGYASFAGFAGPMFGDALFLVALASSVAAFVAIASDYHKKSSRGAIVALPALLWFAFFAIAFSGSGMLNASEYRALIGDMEKRVWTQDIQPKDPDHPRLVLDENALYLARKQVGDFGTIGSQFEIHEDSVTLQAIKGELWYIVPLDFKGWQEWRSTGSVPGYLKVHAEDPNRKPIAVQLPKEKQFVYTPDAFFGNNLVRHLRLDSANLRVDLKGTHLEIDEDGTPWWITSVLAPSIGQYGDKVKGVQITDPVSGVSKFYSLGAVPEWVDRVVPSEVTKDYINYWGNYVHDWLNTVWLVGAKRDLVEAGDTQIIYGSIHSPMFVTGVTSQNDKDDSLVGIVYTHTRTGKSTFYEIKGGATDDAVVRAVDKSTEIQFRHLSGGDPQLYNLYGTMASIVPLTNDNHSYQGAAIVNINNVNGQIATGRSLAEAIRQYQRLVGQSGDMAHIEKERKLSIVEGVLVRAKQDLTQTGAVYYVVIEGKKQAFIGGTGEFPLLPLAQVGDRVKIEYFASGESVVPIHSFENLTLPLEGLPAQKAVDARKLESRNANK